MRELWANGEHYPNVRRFLSAIGIPDDKQRSCYKPILHALREGTGSWLHAGTSYAISPTAPAAPSSQSTAERERKARQSILAISRPRAVAAAEPEPEENYVGKRRLLSRSHATVGLHQDKGDHYAG